MFKVSCLCGATAQEVGADFSRLGHGISLCHCDTCRHGTGLLCTSYYPISTPDLARGVAGHKPPSGSTRCFCTTCGCHVFRSTASEDGEELWEVSTGAVVGATGEDYSTVHFSKHENVADTLDGGASTWIVDYDGLELEVLPGGPSSHGSCSKAPALGSTEDILPASCACGNVQFHVSRPNADSYLPRSTYPDLTHPYSSTDASNPSDEKWWVCGEGKRYRAGTCACASCRLASGFEIQTWAFIPRTNIVFQVPGPDGETKKPPLDFDTLPEGILQSYASSSGVLREFCRLCGATVFWHDRFRPDVVDVSVGLLGAKEGAKAESWLEWWAERVSFAEEVGVKRAGAPAEAGKKLVEALERGLKEWRHGE